MKFGLIGLGKWASNYIATLNGLEQDIPLLCSIHEESLSNLRDLPKSFKWENDYERVCQSLVDTIIVATPPQSHYKITKCALENGKHVICEKPFVFKEEEALELTKLAKEKNLNLVVNFIHLWQAPIGEMRHAAKTINGPKYIELSVAAPRTLREHHSVFWDWACHDIAIAQFLMEEYPIDTNIIFNGPKLFSSSKVVIHLIYKTGKVFIEIDLSLSHNKSRLAQLTIEDSFFIWKDTLLGKPLERMLKEFISTTSQKAIYNNLDLALDVTKIMNQLEYELL